MKLSTKSEYGTRAMLDLAIHQKNEPVLMRDISERQNITFKYLGQLFLLLKNSGLIRGHRGASGGYTLTRPPDEITLLEIFESLEGPISLTECTINKMCCPKTENCITHDIWSDTRDMISSFFKSITLKDLVNKYKAKNCPVCSKKDMKSLPGNRCENAI